MTEDRLVRLHAFLRDAVRLPFVWGQRDCSLWACDWIRAERGIDPAQALRGTYASRSACARLLVEAGGLPTLASALAARAGLIETDAVEAGDVGVIEIGLGAYLGISTGSAWAIKSADGLVVAPAQPIRVWAV